MAGSPIADSLLLRGIQPLLRIITYVAVTVVTVGATTWGFLAVYYSYLWPTIAGKALALSLLVAALGALASYVVRRWRRPTFTAFLLVFLGVLLWWSSIEPSNDRDWKTEVAILPEVSWSGNLVTVRNIRNFEYKTPLEFVPAYYEKTFDLDELETVDLIASYWAGPAIAHIFISFGFGNDEYVSVSIERRDERGEGYSTLKGLFKQYEIFFVVADERDVIRLRTNIRKDPPEDVHMYQVRGPLEIGRKLFVEYMRRVNKLSEQPEFYNTITSNCAGNIWLNAHVNPGRVPFSWKILLSGHVPEYLYERGLLDTQVSFSELKEMSRINEAARAASDSVEFSRLIRVGLPIESRQ